MRAAIYARYSSDLQREASIADQIRLCEERIRGNGWTIAEIFRDQAISGASMGNRPGVQGLLSGAKEGKFDIVVAEALDRLSRDQEDIAAIFKRLAHCDISILTLAEGQVDELHIGLKGTMNALFLKDLAAKIRRGQRGRIAEGYSAGGLSYGYRIVRELANNGEVVRGRRAIDRDQAAVVERIFAEYVAGKSPRAIAAGLNREGIRSPRGGQWNASTINGHRARRNGILQNELYIGVLIYNRLRMVKDPDTGKCLSRLNPPTEWIIEKVPDLRIISDKVWDAAQALRTRHGGQSAHMCRRPKRLFSGLLRCGACGGGYTIGRPGRYGCSAHREKGTCTNGRQIAADTLEARILSGLKDNLLHPRFLQEFITAFRAELARLRKANIDDRPNLKARLADTDARIHRIVLAIADGTDTPSMRQQLMDLEALKVQLVHSLETAPDTPVIELHPHLPDLYRKRVETLETVLRSDKPLEGEAAGSIRSWIAKIVLSPGQTRGEMGIEVFGEPAAVLALATGNPAHAQLGVIKVVAEEGFEPPTQGL